MNRHKPLDEQEDLLVLADLDVHHTTAASCASRSWQCLPRRCWSSRAQAPSPVPLNARPREAIAWDPLPGVDPFPHKRTLEAHVQQLGGNAVLGVRFDSSDVGDGLAEVVAYGTAVLVEPA